MKFCRGLFLLIFVASLGMFLSGCGKLTSTDPAADGARFNGSFYFYYSEECRYDGVGTYSCGPINRVSPALSVRLRVDSDGFAKLTIDSQILTYTEDEYRLGYDGGYGKYFRFEEGMDRVDLYTQADMMAIWGYDGYVTFYYYDFPY